MASLLAPPTRLFYNSRVLSSDEKIIQSYFQRQPDVEAVFLFGSAAKGRSRPDSDLDLAVLLDRSVPEETYLPQRLTFAGDLSLQLKTDVDVVILNEAGPVLKHQVLLYGRLLYETDHRLITRFKARAWLEYFDWLPYKKKLDASVLKHFRSRPAHG